MSIDTPGIGSGAIRRHEAGVTEGVGVADGDGVTDADGIGDTPGGSGVWAQLAESMAISAMVPITIRIVPAPVRLVDSIVTASFVSA